MAKNTPGRSKPGPVIDKASLLEDLRSLVNSGRRRVAVLASSTQLLLYWRVGQRLLKEDLHAGRGAYGKQILATVSRELKSEFGDGFSYSSLTRMVRFAEIQADEAIVATLSQQLGWSHVLALLPIKDPLARDFYAEMCRIERWDVRTLRKKIGGMLFERTALSKNTKAVITAEIGQLRDGRVTPEAVFRPLLPRLPGVEGRL